MVSPHRSGFTIMRIVWLFACGTVAGTPGDAGVKGKARLTSRGALTPAKVPDGAVIQLATHFFLPPSPSLAIAAAATLTLSSSILTNFALRFDMLAVSGGEDGRESVRHPGTRWSEVGSTKIGPVLFQRARSEEHT